MRAKKLTPKALIDAVNRLTNYKLMPYYRIIGSALFILACYVLSQLYSDSFIMPLGFILLFRNLLINKA